VHKLAYLIHCKAQIWLSKGQILESSYQTSEESRVRKSNALSLGEARN
jgi:hypothetical protein